MEFKAISPSTQEISRKERERESGLFCGHPAYGSGSLALNTGRMHWPLDTNQQNLYSLDYPTRDIRSSYDRSGLEHCMQVSVLPNSLSHV